MAHIAQDGLEGMTEQDQRHARGEYRVPAGHLETLERQLAKLNRRAVKLGCAPAVLERLGVELEPVQGPNGKPTGELREYVLLRLTGSAPQLAGWTFVAALDVLEGGTKIRAVPGETVPVEYRTRTLACDHCQKPRRRVKHYLVRNEAGAYKVVGSSCLADFLGHQDPAAFARGAEWLSGAADLCGEAEGGYGGGYGAPRLYDTQRYLAAVVCAIETWGWRSRKTAQEQGRMATCTEAENILDPKAWGKRQDLCPEITPAHEAEAVEVHAWLKALAARTGLNDYEHNLSVTSSGPELRWADVGLAASAVVAVRRSKAAVVQQRAAPAKSTGYIGQVGEKVEFAATILSLGSMASDWGAVAIVKLIDEAGRTAVWFASAALPHDVEVGKKVQVKGTVKSHKEYHGAPDTTLTRCKIKTLQEVQ